MHVATGRAWRSIADKGDKNREDGALHASDVMGCLRQQHYRYNKTRKTDPSAPHNQTRISAVMGTAIDKVIVPEIARQLRMLFPKARVCSHPTTTVTVQGVRFRGTPDIRVDWSPTQSWIVDVKTVGRDRYNHVREHGVISNHSYQASIHAVLAELHHKVTVDSLMHYYVDRDAPDAYPGCRPRQRWVVTDFSQALRSTANRRIQIAAEAAKGIVNAPRWFRSIGEAQRDGSPCVSCPWRRKCLS